MNRKLNYARVVLVVAVLILVGSRQQIVGAAPTAAATTEWCQNVCGEEVSCTQVCLFAAGENPPIEITCGEYDGGPTNDWCDGNGCEHECSWWPTAGQVCWWEDQETNCEGYGEYGFCGDDICVPAQAESCYNCYQDCGSCPSIPTCDNDVCEHGETWRSCPDDCALPTGGECEDDICDELEDGESCPEDCTFSGDWCGGFQECPEGWECVDEVCVWETDPVYKCCKDSPDGTVDCENGAEVCDVLEFCGRFTGAAPSDPGVCLPVWWNPGS